MGRPLPLPEDADVRAHKTEVTAEKREIYGEELHNMWYSPRADMGYTGLMANIRNMQEHELKYTDILRLTTGIRSEKCIVR